MEEKIEKNNEKEAAVKEFVLTPDLIEKFLAWLKEDVRFTAEEIRDLSLNEETLFTEEELFDILDKEIDREILDMDTELIDSCLWALENGLYKAEDS